MFQKNLKNNGSDYHHQAEEQREKDNHFQALKLIQKAIDSYKKEKNFSGLAEAFQSRVLIYKHLYLLEKDKKYLTSAKKDAALSWQIVRKYKIKEKISSCYFRLGELQMIAKNYPQAENYFQKAVDFFQGNPAEKGDLTYHLGEAVFLKGEKEKGKKLLLQGLKIIQDNQDKVESFAFKVWQSGCLLKLAKLLRQEEPQKAQDYLKKAEIIINKDKRLIIRKRQLEQFINS